MTGTCQHCGITGPYMITVMGRVLCEHVRACEARMMLQDGRTIQEAVAHAQSRAPDPRIPHG